MISNNDMFDLIGKRARLATWVKPFLCVGSGLRVGTFIPLTLIFRPVIGYSILQRSHEYFITTIKPAFFTFIARYLHSKWFFQHENNNSVEVVNIEEIQSTLSSRISILRNTVTSLHANKSIQVNKSSQQTIHKIVFSSQSFFVDRDILRESTSRCLSLTPTDKGRSDCLQRGISWLTCSSKNELKIIPILSDIRSSDLPQRKSSSLSWSSNQVWRYLVKDFGSSQSAKSTRLRDSLLCLSHPASWPLRFTFASSALATQHSRRWPDATFGGSLSFPTGAMSTTDKQSPLTATGDYASSPRSPWRAANEIILPVSPNIRRIDPLQSRISQSTRTSNNELKDLTVNKRTIMRTRKEADYNSRINTTTEENYRFKRNRIYSDAGKSSIANGSSGLKKAIYINREKLYFSQQTQMNLKQNQSQQISRGAQKGITTNGVYRPPLPGPGLGNSAVVTQQSDSNRNVDLDKLIDIDRLTQTVMQKINKHIRIERERRGLL